MSYPGHTSCTLYSGDNYSGSEEKKPLVGNYAEYRVNKPRAWYCGKSVSMYLCLNSFSDCSGDKGLSTVGTTRSPSMVGLGGKLTYMRIEKYQGPNYPAAVLFSEKDCKG